jgi:putative addiction module component (TIGR02574 family)
VAHLGRFERLQMVQDLWDAFAAETGMDTRPDVLDELASRATHRLCARTRSVSVLACVQYQRSPARWPIWSDAAIADDSEWIW